MEEGKGHTFVARGVAMDEGEKLADEDVDADMEDALTDAVPVDVLDDETRELAAGLASLDEGELLSALEAMQKAVIRPKGDKVLVAFVLASPHCAEIMGAWERGPAAATAVPVMLLLYYIFRHPLGKGGGATTPGGSYKTEDSNAEKEAHRKVMAVKLRLDKVARSIVRTRMKDIYSHLSSSQKSRQNAALLLLSAIVLRGRALAIEIATSFDFTLEALRKLGHPPKQGAPHKTLRVDEGGHRGILKRPTRVAFVELAISFLTVGDPGLLRWILQKRPLWIGVLHGISKDDERTVVRVLRLLQEKVMASAFMVPRGLQSVLFGDATLEQLARISAVSSLADAGDVAHATLISLCTDPAHGLCPAESELSEAVHSRGRSAAGAFGGGQGRLLRLMLRLKVTEVDRHREVLLATARTRPKLAILYLASFPLSLEPRVSPAWFNAMSLVAQLIAIASQPSSFSSLAAQSLAPQPKGHLIQSMLQSLMPGSLSRVVLNRGLLHADFMVKQASLRVLLEALLCLRRLINAVDDAIPSEPAQRTSEEDSSLQQELRKLCQSVQDFMRASLPDPNTLLAILSGLKLPHSSSTIVSSPPTGSPATKKRKRREEQKPSKQHELKSFISDAYDYNATISLIWGGEVPDTGSEKEGIERFLHAKVVQVLAAYQMALPVAMADTFFDAFKLLPDDPTTLSGIQQKSVSALLLAATGSSSSMPSEESGWISGGPAGFGSAYRNFKQLLMFMLISEGKDVSDAVYEVVHRVMAGTGAFESNPMEISLWLDVLVLWKIDKPASAYASLVDFLSEAVSSIGQNSYKYLDSLHSMLSDYVLLEDADNSDVRSGALEGASASEFGPFVVCALERFMQTISKSKMSAGARSTTALYLVNVLDRLLKHQMNPQSLATVVVTLITRERESLPPERVESAEWTVLLMLLERARLLLSGGSRIDSRGSSASSSASTSVPAYRAGALAEVLKACRADHDQTVDEKLSTLSSALVCVSVGELVENFPPLVKFCLEELDGDFSLPIALFCLHEGALSEVSTAWPEFFTGALELAFRVKYCGEDSLTTGKAKELTEMHRSSSSSLTVESYGFCLLLLVAPFPVLFSAATYGTRPVLLTSQAFTGLLRGSLLRVRHRLWVCTGRLIVSGMKQLAAPSVVEDKGDEAPLYACFSLLCSLMLPSQQSSSGGLSSQGLTESVYERVIVDVLKHPVFYELFMRVDGTLRPPSAAPCSFASDLRRDTKDNKIGDASLRRVLASAASCIRPIDCHILSVLKQVVGFSKTVVKSAFHDNSHGARAFRDSVLSAYKPYALKAIGSFQKEVDESLPAGLVASPALFAVSVLIPCTDPSLVLSIFLSLLSKMAVKVKSSKQAAVSPHVLGLYFVTVLVDSWSGAAAASSHLDDELGDEAQSGGPPIYALFEKVVDHVTGSPSIMADLCLLSLLQAPRFGQLPSPGLDWHFPCLTKKTSTALACSTPLEVLRHCVCHPNKVTGKIAFLLAETSAVHVEELGRLVAVGTSAKAGPDVLRKANAGVGLAEVLLTRNAGSHQKKKTEFVLADEDLMFLLPAAQVYLASESKRAGVGEGGNEMANHIASVYAKLLTKQLKKWEKFVSERIAMAGAPDVGFPMISPVPGRDLYDPLLQLCNCSPMGEIVRMLESCHGFCFFSVKVKTRLIQSLLPEDDVPLVAQNAWLSAGDDISPCVFEAVAKADIIGHLLSSGSGSQASENASKSVTEGQAETKDSPSRENSSVWQRFLRSFVSTLDMLYKSQALDGKRTIDNHGIGTQSEAAAGRAHWVHFLEEYVLVRITNVARELVKSCVDMSEYLPLYEYSMTTLLRYGYGRTFAMNACRHLTFVVFQGLQSQVVPSKDTSPSPSSSAAAPADGDVLELMMAHSKFLSSLLIVDSKRTHIPHISGKHAGKGTALNSLSSVLSLTGSPVLLMSEKGNKISTIQDTAVEPTSVVKWTVSSETTAVSRNSRDGVNRLEIVKLLRILLGVRLKQFTLGTVDVRPVPLDEVMSILLAAYGGTLNAVDQEIFLLMQEIESHGGLGFSGLAGLDYLWGEAALKRRKRKAEEVTMNVLKDEEEPDSIDELRRQTFKEDLLIDPRRCGLTVLFFPSTRKLGGADIGQLGLACQYKESGEEISERSSADGVHEDLKDAAYDPAFLLPFALHGLSIGCINAEEFVQLGLLAVAFASVSSAEESMRKAGYELLAKYYGLLEDGPSFKGRLQIRLLMTYVKNAVTEPWQRIPAVFAVFAAEASCILMHPESNQYAIINRYLLRAPNLDLESIPLLQVMFGSGSVQYRSERLWMLRLLANGLRTSLDARVYRRKFVLELLMSFHDSSMADTFPRKWVLQVLYQGAGVRSFAQYLVEHTGLISWLSSVALNDVEGGLGLQDEGGSGQLASVALQVIERILSWENLHRHFLLDCLEELSKAGHVFLQILVRNPTRQNQNLFQTSTLKILLTLVSLSHKRRKHQTRFTLNLGGLVEVLHLDGSAAVISATESPIVRMEDQALALQLVLHVPPHPVYLYEDKLALLKVASWAHSVALEVERGEGKGTLAVDSNHLRTGSEVRESVTAKLLRWLAASVVLGDLAKEGRGTESTGFFARSSVTGCLKSTDFTERDTARKEVDEKLGSLLLGLEGHVSGKTEGTSLVPVAAAAILTRRTRSAVHLGGAADEVAQQSILELLLHELPCPEETNVSWQWSFNCPWTARDESVQYTDESAAQARYVSEICRTVLILLQQILSTQRPHNSSQLSHWEALLSLNNPQTDQDSDNDSIGEIVGFKLSRLRTKLCSALQRIRIPCH